MEHFVSLTIAERELLEAFLIALRRQDGAGGTKHRTITYSDILRTLNEQARLMEAQMKPYGLSSEVAENLDAAANLIRAVCIEMPDIKPLLDGFGKRAKAARYGCRGWRR